MGLSRRLSDMPGASCSAVTTPIPLYMSRMGVLPTAQFTRSELLCLRTPSKPRLRTGSAFVWPLKCAMPSLVLYFVFISIEMYMDACCICLSWHTEVTDLYRFKILE